MTGTPTTGVEGFLQGLRECGLDPRMQGEVITFVVGVPAGLHSGRNIATGVSVTELVGWPMMPPHWIHLPQEIAVGASNLDAVGTLPGWVRHSRQIFNWGNAEHPAQAWIAHVRGVLLVQNVAA